MSDNTKKRYRIATVDLAASALNVYGAPSADGKQPVAFSFPVDPSAWPASMVTLAAIRGWVDIAAGSYNRIDDPSPENVRAILDKLQAQFVAGTYEPGRAISEREPTLLERALAEATGTPVADMVRDIEDRVQLNPDGTVFKDERGRTRRVFTAKVLDGMARDPSVAPILARLTREEADRLAREARAHKSDAPTGALDLFKRPSQHQEAAQ